MEKLLLHLEKWLSMSPSRNPAVLARKASVAPSTVRRALQRESLLEETTAKKLLLVTASHSEFTSLMTEAYPDTCDYFNLMPDTPKRVGPAFPEEWYLRDPLSFEIFVMTANDYGYSNKYLRSKLGADADKRIDELLEDERSGLYLKGGRLYCQRVFTHCSQDILKMGTNANTLISKNIEKFKRLYFYTSVYSDAENKKISAKIDEVMETVKEINDKKELEECLGDSPTVIYLAIGSLENEIQIKGALHE